MTKDKAKKLLPVIIAFSENKKIQGRMVGASTWIDLSERSESNPSFDNDDYEFRIKPEPKVIWCNEYSDGSGFAFTSEEEAHNNFSRKYAKIAVKYIEAIDD